ncbi:MAG: pilus assembly protein TadG-related protein [Pirellulaceae bacterium]
MSRNRKQLCRRRAKRRGFLTVLSAFMMIGLFAFLAFAVDTGLMVLTQTNMQNACDAAALAASQEITAAVNEAGNGGEEVDVDSNSIAVNAAREMASTVAAMNGVYIDPDEDVTFGKRNFDEGTGEWPITWGEGPYNVVRVQARRDQQDVTEPDGRLPLAFGWAVGMSSAELTTSASAFVEARDIVMVLDFSGSMNDDSTLDAIDTLGRTNVEDNMEDIYDALGPPNLGSMPFEPEWLTVTGAPPANGSQPQIHVTFKKKSIDVESTKDLSNVVLRYTNGSTQKFDGLSGTSGTFAGTGYYSGKTISRCWVKSGSNESGDGPGYGERFDDDDDAVREAYGLDSIPYPYDSGSWNDFIDYCRDDNQVDDAGYEWKYGGLLFVNYLLTKKPKHSQTADLWKTPHYPFHAMKNGATLFCDFLEDLGFGDELGLVSYATTARVESFLDEDGEYVDLSSDLITPVYSDVNIIQRHKQANHYDNTTGMGYGIKEGRELLQGNGRYGARPTMLVMTDGLANVGPYGFSLPGGWDWADYTDYDGDGTADYTTNNSEKEYAFYQAVQAANAGITVHTLSVGSGADTGLMKAIAFVGGGVWINVPGGTSIAEMESEMLVAFGQIAAKVPPPKLVYEDGVE